MAKYLWLTIISRKTIMTNYGFFKGKINDKQGKDYRNAILAVNKYYLPGKYHTNKYYKETDIVLRNLRALHECNIENFKLEEFKCECGGRYCSGYPFVMNRQLLINLQKLRTDFKKGITITSAMRCDKYNNSLVGSIRGSKHTKGKAVDLYIPGITDTLGGRMRVMNRWKKMPKYNYTYCNVNGSHPNMGNAVHVDVR